MEIRDEKMTEVNGDIVNNLRKWYLLEMAAPFFSCIFSTKIPNPATSC